MTASSEAQDVQRMSQEIERLREQLRFSEQFLATVFELAPYPMVVIELPPEGPYRVVRANRAGWAMVGGEGAPETTAKQIDDSPPSVAAGQAGSGFVPETVDTFRERLVAAVKSGTTQSYHEELQMHDRTVWTQALYTPFPSDNPPNAWVSIATFDVTEQKLRELETLALREQIIAQQTVTLNELSTPLLSISDHVIALPLIGAIDTHRAQQIIETLLRGISEANARTAIIDITGVNIVDTQVANTIIRAAQAARLLGAGVVLTGIRPEIAQVMVSLGVDLGTIVTRSSLQAGITYSLRT